MKEKQPKSSSKTKKATRTWTEWIGKLNKLSALAKFIEDHGAGIRARTKQEYVSWAPVTNPEPKKVRVTITVEEVER